jgi:hypothetical protein
MLADETKRDAMKFWLEWPTIALGGLTAPLMRTLEPTAGRETERIHRFSDALIELQRLLDEVQFSASVAYMLLRDFAVRHPGAETLAPPGPTAMPVQALALLAPHIAPTRPFLIMDNVHAELPGPQYLSRGSRDSYWTVRWCARSQLWTALLLY